MKKLQSLEEVKAAFKGKGGLNPESENILVDSGADKAEGFLTVWGNRAEIAKIIDRCGRLVTKFDATEDGAHLTIDRKAFRGLEYCFKKVKADGANNKKSEAAKARMDAYWSKKKEGSK